MDSSIWVVIASMVTAVGAVVGAIVTTRNERRRLSGRVSTTDADALWKEAGDLRRQYQTEIVELRRAQAAAEAEIQALRLEVRAKDQRIEHLESENAKLADRVAELEQELRHRLEAASRAATSFGTTGGGEPAHGHP